MSNYHHQQKFGVVDFISVVSIIGELCTHGQKIANLFPLYSAACVHITKLKHLILIIFILSCSNKNGSIHKIRFKIIFLEIRNKMDRDDIDLSRLILETRKLATENAAFCEIHSKQGTEIQTLKKIGETHKKEKESLLHKITQLNIELSSKSKDQNNWKSAERELKKKLRSLEEDLKIERDNRTGFEEKLKTFSDQKTEFETRLKLTRSEVQALRHQNTGKFIQ
jgi:chromosome segregation ATPase